MWREQQKLAKTIWKIVLKCVVLCCAAFVKWNDAVFLKHHSTCIVSMRMLRFISSTCTCWIMYTAVRTTMHRSVKMQCAASWPDHHRPRWVSSIPFYSAMVYKFFSCYLHSVIYHTILFVAHNTWICCAHNNWSILCASYVYCICIVKSIKSRTARKFFKIG